MHPASKYFVQCECGNHLPVTAGMAGSPVRCECGREMKVPGLSQLRRESGQEAYITNSVEAAIVALKRGVLPGSECVLCHAATDAVVRCRIFCEISQTNSDIEKSGGSFWQGLVEVLLFPITYSVRFRKVPIGETQGRDTAIDAEFCLCWSCPKGSGNLHSKRVLAKLLRTVPQYAAVLKEFPQAQLQLVHAPDLERF